MPGGQVRDNSFLESLPKRHLHSRCAGSKELTEERVVVRQLGYGHPIVLLPPKVRIEEVDHIVPLEALLEELDVFALRLGFREIDLRIAIGRDVARDGIEELEEPSSQECDNVLSLALSAR